MIKAFLYTILSSALLSGTVGSPVLTPSELNTNATKFNGQTVQVRGYISLAPDGHILYESKKILSDFQRGVDAGGYFDAKSYRKYCLTLADAEFLFRNIRTVNKKTLIIRGTFIDDYLGPGKIDLGACPLPTAIIIDEEDLRHRYPALLPVK